MGVPIFCLNEITLGVHPQRNARVQKRAATTPGGEGGRAFELVHFVTPRFCLNEFSRPLFRDRQNLKNEFFQGTAQHVVMKLTWE